ncbi:lipase maturation factor family protein [Microbacterium sp. zg.Y1090]|uniref:lipase maturation factor family protein n=1 Tax=Microbacterium TaxID=33882 RepID=UPI00214BEB8C|nr:MULTISPECIES: lipase maturation factor family protein [unclassified Microbacterium]MCR2812462.1 lipase maturation factor family protein [Microbacterium sp. zg.Y1084]MCR2817737.1 lipase maturation factor family protein [Microbacterium sp. zg.Y1090]MDL5485620.1 lipase maturation factor family protein [Microbacterium sp. zg-Y1211]WIM28791.1 lipase maturation factor family protein [Microbacterium sp. zg-Y1090]
MDGFAAVDFEAARQVLQRGIAALYIVAFLSTFHQFRALLGERGLLPAPELLAWATASPRRARMVGPTLFRRVRYSDRRLRALCVAGMTVGAALVAGTPQLGPPWVPMVCFLLLWLGYMSVVSIGQTFYGFGWEMLLLEAGFVAAFLGSDDQPPPTVVIVLLWWLLFRLEFGAGMIKIRGGREWRDLTALMFHHETQPMPGPLSRQAHLLPRWFHRLEVVGNHFSQLVVPWFLFAPLLGLWVPGPVPSIVGTVAGGIVIVTQLWLVLTGNFAWLNWATIVLGFAAVSVPGSGAPPASDPPWVVDGLPLYWLVITSGVGLLYVVISWPALRNLAARRQLMNASFNRWQLANAYGAFGTVTRERVEYIIEGTTDPDPETATWREYGFRGKPGDVRRIPRQWAPYHLRLDWLMWFLPLGRSLEGWFAALLGRLLEADAATLALLRVDPFAGDRPRWVRVVSYRYRFATHAEFRRDRVRWVRDRRRVLVRPIGARDVG